MIQQLKTQIGANNYFKIIISVILCITILSNPIFKQIKLNKLSDTICSMDYKSNESDDENDSDKKNESIDFLSNQSVLIPLHKTSPLLKAKFSYILDLPKTKLEILIPPPKI